MDGTGSDLPANDVVTLTELDGTGGRELTMSVRSSGQLTQVFADAVFNMPHAAGVQGFVFRRITRSSGGPCVTNISRAVLIKDKRAFAVHLQRLAVPDLTRIIVAHHEIISEEPAAVLKRVAESV